MKRKCDQGGKQRIHNFFMGPMGGWGWGCLAMACCGILAATMLFVKNLGVGDDGTLRQVMTGAGLSYPDEVTASPGYFQRRYVWSTEHGVGYQSFQTVVIWAAKMLGRLITGSRSFDIRFLGAVYLCLYLPAVCLLVKAATDRVSTVAQKLLLTAAAVLIFADVGYVTYFNSFYPEAMLFLCLLYMAGAAMNLQRKSRFEMVYLVLFAAACVALCFVRKYCFLAGIIGGTFTLAQCLRMERSGPKAGAFVLAGVLITASFGSVFLLADDFHKEDQLHAMSRGVLMQAEDPEKALAAFGIDPSYSLLTDVSAYDLFPLTAGENPALEDGFLDRYTSWDIAAYYMSHPAQMISMVDSAVKMNLEVRRGACGNFTEDSGMPQGSQSSFWSAYSFFKNRSAPKTIGYLAILVLVSAALTAKDFSPRREKNRKNTVYLEVVAALTVLTVLQTCLVIVKSGEPALLQYNGQLGMVMDILLFFTITEAVGRLKTI